MAQLIRWCNWLNLSTDSSQLKRKSDKSLTTNAEFISLLRQQEPNHPPTHRHPGFLRGGSHRHEHFSGRREPAGTTRDRFRRFHQTAAEAYAQPQARRHYRGIGRIIAPKRPSMPAPIPEKHYRFSGSSAANAAPFTTGDNIQQLGMTLWRLRPVTGIDRGQRLLIRENGKSSEWLPERIEMNTPLRVGERVRLTIESPHEGYLYVIERDLFAGGKLGDVKLIFPTRSLPGDENQVRPGKLIDLPGQADNPNYFTTSLSRSDQVGEIFTIIITDTPLDSIIGNQRQLISAVDLAKWEREWGSESERFELEGGAGMVWTKEEKEASAGPASRQLTTDDPTPQTIYRIAATNKTAFLINVRLGYAR